MSKKYYERVLKGSGVQSKKFHSNFGESILKKFGWESGDGLGKEKNGTTVPLQIRRKDDLLGLGAKSKQQSENQWTNWWDELYNTTADKLAISDTNRTNCNKKRKKSENDSAEAEKTKYSRNGRVRTASLSSSSSSSSSSDSDDNSELCSGSVLLSSAVSSLGTDEDSSKRLNKKRRLLDSELSASHEAVKSEGDCTAVVTDGVKAGRTKKVRKIMNGELLYPVSEETC